MASGEVTPVCTYYPVLYLHSIQSKLCPGVWRLWESRWGLSDSGFSTVGSEQDYTSLNRTSAQSGSPSEFRVYI